MHVIPSLGLVRVLILLNHSDAGHHMPGCRTRSVAWILALISLTVLTSICLRRLAPMSPPAFRLTSQVTLTDDPPAQRPGYMSVDLPRQGQTTASYWLQDGANPLAREGADSAFADENVDVVVIGSGITGVSAVHHLVQGMKNEKLDRLKVVLLEARDFCGSGPQ